MEALKRKGKHSCPTCPKTYAHRSGLKDHIQNKHVAAGKRYQCTYCEKLFGNMSNRDRHQQIVHLGLKKYQCDICGLPFTFKWLVSNHKKQHHGIGEKLGCPCGKSFSHTSNFYAHQRICKTINPTNSKGGTSKQTCWVCSTCGKQYTTKAYLRNHFKFVHEKDQDIICDICGERFSRPDSLNRHKQRKHSK